MDCHSVSLAWRTIQKYGQRSLLTKAVRSYLQTRRHDGKKKKLGVTQTRMRLAVLEDCKFHEGDEVIVKVDPKLKRVVLERPT